jgi:hypothetical protein
MAGITAREREDKARILDIKAKLKEPMPLYLFQKMNASLTALQRTQDKRVAARKAKVEAERAARAEAAPKPWMNVLPDNMRGPRGVPPSVVVAADAGWPDLSHQGQA